MRPSINDFTTEEDKMLAAAVKKHGTCQWGKIATYFNGRCDLALMTRWQYLREWKKIHTKWSLREDALLVYYYRHYKDMVRVSRTIQTRTPIQCSVRFSYLVQEDLTDYVIEKYKRLKREEQELKANEDGTKDVQRDKDKIRYDNFLKPLESKRVDALKDHTVECSFAHANKSNFISAAQLKNSTFRSVDNESAEITEYLSFYECEDNFALSEGSLSSQETGVSYKSVDVKTVNVEEPNKIASGEMSPTTNNLDNANSHGAIEKDVSHASVAEKKVDVTELKSVEESSDKINDASVVRKSIAAPKCRCVKKSTNRMCNSGIKITPISDMSLLILAVVMLSILLFLMLLLQFSR